MPVIAILMSRVRLRLAMRRGHAVKIFVAWLVAMSALHVAAMMRFEGMSLGDAVWLTFVTATTVGYGDVSAKTFEGRASTIVIMFFGTIFVVASLASLLFERAAERRERKLAGKWRWNLKDHILVISTTGTENARYLAALVTQIRADPAHAHRQVMLMTHGFDEGGLPDRLADAGVVHVRGDGDSDDEMALAGARDAHLVAVLGDSRTPKADALVFDVVTRVRAAGFAGRVVSECEDDRNRARLASGEMDASVRPSRGYPEMLARAIVTPGSEQVIEDMFTAGGAECEYVDLGRTRNMGPWRDVVARLVVADLGTPIAYRSEGRVTTAPPANEPVTGEGVYVIMRSRDQQERKERIREALRAA